MKKVLYVPLDDRDCNYDFPYQLSLMTDCLSILRPERALMGSLKRAAMRHFMLSGCLFFAYIIGRLCNPNNQPP